ncbi:uncharacterized protein LOC119976665 isoform X1 [Scyliorhinus canicula]|uniref:uncharacterized protein LOC119976665 isoform X1 n=1 Tax=Scyliorhinus canicula TaxID=7830 RepID=UPI0018F5A770|nr:uncharacterized protein LOC119976665 isoform X1 [Scyliorhinus canicula]
MEDKPFLCDVCRMAFTQSSDLLTHQGTHIEEKPFMCEMCHQAFTQSSTFLRHQCLHTGEKPIQDENMATENVVVKEEGQNFTDDELDTLLHAVEQRRVHILGRGKSKPTRKQQSVAWEQVADILSVNIEVPRTADQCRKELNYLMCSARTKQAHNTQEHSLTGGGLAHRKNLTPQEEGAWQLLVLSKPVGSGDGDVGLSQAFTDATATAGQDEGDSRIPARDLIVTSTWQPCSAEAAAEAGEALQLADISAFDGDVQRDGVAEEEAACDAMAAVMKEEHSEPSGGEESSAAESPAPPGRHLDNRTGDDVTDELLIRQLFDFVTETAGRFEASARSQAKSLTDVVQQLQRVAEVHAQHVPISQQMHELLKQREDILSQRNEVLRQRKDISLQQNELLRQQNEYLQIINRMVTPAAAPTGQEPPHSETVAAGQNAASPVRQEVTSRRQGRGRGRRRRN